MRSWGSWIWTASAWGSKSLRKPDYIYPYVAEDGREDPEGNRNLRILRGTSWYDEVKYARCAFRLSHFPGHDNNHVGFRVVEFPGGF